MKRIVSLLLCVIMLGTLLFGCSFSGSNIPTESDLMKGIKPQELNETPVEVGGENAVAPTDFAIRLFKASFIENENIMVSPMSVFYALSMTANGANGETLAQMENVLGISITELNAYLKSYKNSLPADEKYKLNIANSIWFTDDESFTVKPNFLQANANYYGADIFKVPFNDDTLNNINSWVKDKTDGMIENILNKIPNDAVMYLINAMAFDAEWKEIYNENQIRDGIFTTRDGKMQTVKMMYSEEYSYLEDENAVGFIKPYADSKYAFVALLPNEGITVEEYISSMNGEKLAALFAEPQEIKVYASMPKFENEYSTEMSDILISMGMKDAFDVKTADFSGIGTSTVGNIFINRVIHKTFIAVDEKGTKAGAATVVEMNAESMIEEDFKTVSLNRPFVYMIIDCEANLPLFIGTVAEVE